MPQIELNPNLLLIATTSKVVGGKWTKRQKLREDQQEATLITQAKVTVTIENVEERKEAEALIARARDLVRGRGTCSAIGYLADKARWPEIEQAMSEAREDALRFNRRAKTCHVVMDWVKLEISVAIGPEAAQYLASHVQEKLSDVREALRAGNANGSRAALHAAKNLEKLAVGTQRDAIVQALECAKGAYRQLLEALKPKNGVQETPESAGRGLDLDWIETAIVLFDYQTTSAPVEELAS